MKLTITHSIHHFFKNLAIFSVILLIASCNEDQRPPHFKSYEKLQLATSNGKIIQAFAAKTEEQQIQGLSGVKPEELADHEGMLFIYQGMGPRSFWMPNTFISLDIIFLNGQYQIIHIERDVPAHPGMEEPPKIARTPTVYAQYVLELAATSPLAKELKKGDHLTLLNPPSNQEHHPKE